MSLQKLSTYDRASCFHATCRLHIKKLFPGSCNVRDFYETNLTDLLTINRGERDEDIELQELSS
jgi:hypothetical protein